MTALSDSVARDPRGIVNFVEREAPTATQFYTNGLVSFNSAGYVVPATTSTGPVIGVYTGPELLTTVNGQKVQIETGLEYKFSGTGFVQADVGHQSYVVDDNTIAPRSTGPLAGTITDFISATEVWIKPGCVDDDKREIIYSPKVVDAAAGTVTAVSPIYYHVGPNKTVTGVTIVPGAALTASDTVYATITVSKRSSAGGAAVTIASIVTNVASGNWTAAVAKALTLSTTPADLVLTNGDMIQFDIAKASTGTIVPNAVFVISLS
jgi:hypothetical protein